MNVIKKIRVACWIRTNDKRFCVVSKFIEKH